MPTNVFNQHRTVTHGQYNRECSRSSRRVNIDRSINISMLLALAHVQYLSCSHSAAHMAGTFEARYAQRLREFSERAGRGEDVAADEVEYLLNSVPFIKEYTSTKAVADEPRPSGAKNLDSFISITAKSNKNNVLQRYLMHVEKQVDATTMAAVRAHGDEDAKLNPSDQEYVCAECGAGMELHARESMLACPACGACKPHTEMNASNLTYEQEVHQDVVTYFAYKRLNHFCEWLNSLQAKVIFFCVSQDNAPSEDHDVGCLGRRSQHHPGRRGVLRVGGPQTPPAAHHITTARHPHARQKDKESQAQAPQKHTHAHDAAPRGGVERVARPCQRVRLRVIHPCDPPTHPTDRKTPTSPSP